MLTKEMINEALKDSNVCYDWGRNFKNNSVYDLYLTIEIVDIELRHIP